MTPRRHLSRGFTLIELLVSMMIAAIVAGFVAMMIGSPVQAYLATSRRADLSDTAESALRIIDEDVRRALPNSVRVRSIGNLRILEVISVTASLSYRDVWPGRSAMQFGSPVGQFSVLEQPGFAPNQHHVVIDNRRSGTRSAYALTNVITPFSTDVRVNGSEITLSPSFSFASYSDRSANRRAYIVPKQGVIRYECDLGARVLRRYESLPIVSSITTLSAPSTTIATDIAGCTFGELPGSNQNGGMAIVEITVSRTTSGNGTERLRMFRQIRVENPS